MDTIPGIDKTIEKKMQQYSTEKIAAFSKKNIPSKLQYHGADSKAINNVLEWLAEKTSKLSPHQQIKTAMALLCSPYLETRQLAYLYLGKKKQLVESLKPEDLRWLCRDIDNWLLADTLALYILGPMWRQKLLDATFFKMLARSENYWDKRLALVSTVALNLKSRGGTGDAYHTLLICQMLVCEKHPMVAKALSWALRELSKREKEKVENFISENQHQMASFVVREVNSKLQTGRKLPKA